MATKNGKSKRARVIGAEVPAELVDRVEKYREIMAKTFPGSRPTTSDAVRSLIERGLASDAGGSP
jgi:hypothetical protein